MLLLFGMVLSIASPFSRVTEGAEAVLQDLENLSRALVKVSTGDLAAGVSASSESIGAVPSGDLTPMADLFDRLGNAVRDSIRGFSALTNVPCKRLCYVGSDSYSLSGNS
jgi:hypothetical protein